MNEKQNSCNMNINSESKIILKEHISRIYNYREKSILVKS